MRAVINGREFLGRALDQMGGRGLVPSVVENTIRAGTVFPTGPDTIGSYDPINRVRVITDASSGRVVTVIPGAPQCHGKALSGRPVEADQDVTVPRAKTPDGSRAPTDGRDSSKP